MSLWRNGLARSAVNRKVGGSSPPRDGEYQMSSCFERDTDVLEQAQHRAIKLGLQGEAAGPGEEVPQTWGPPIRTGPSWRKPSTRSLALGTNWSLRVSLWPPGNASVQCGCQSLARVPQGAGVSLGTSRKLLGHGAGLGPHDLQRSLPTYTML